MKGKRCDVVKRGGVMIFALAAIMMWTVPAVADFQVSSYQQFAAIADQIQSGDTVRFAAGTYNWGQEVLIGTVDRDNAGTIGNNPSNVTLSGGWNSSFTSRTPGTTVISGQTGAPGGDPGWGLVSFWGPEAVVDGFAFRNNNIEGSILLYASGMPEQAGRRALTIRNCIIANNTSNWQLFLVDHGDFVMENNLIYGSSAAAEFVRVGGRTGTDSAITFVNNIFHQVESGEGGEGSFLDLNGPLQVRNNIFSQNASAANGDGFGGNNVNYNLFHENTNWSNAVSIAQGGTGNIFENPMFTNPGAGNFTLQSGSPAIGAGSGGGNLGASNLPGTDTTGERQPVNVLEFDGSSGYVEIPASTALGLQNFTVTAWFRAGTDVSDHRTMLSRESAEAHNDRTWWINLWDGTGALSARTSSPGENTTLDSTVTVNDQQWHHVAMVMDSGSGVARLFLDGNQIMEQTGRGAPHTPNAPAAIGAQIRGGDPFRFYLGQVSEHRVYNRPLSAAEVANDMNGQVLNGIAGHWPLNDGSGGTAQDMSGNGNHGTIHGGVQWVAVDDHPNAPDSGPAPGPQYALDFNGVDQFVDTSYQPTGNDLGDGGTLEMWVYFRDDTQNFSGSWAEPRFYVARNQDGVFQTGWGSDWEDAGALPLNEWVHLAVTNDGAMSRGYVNGQEIHSYESTFSGENSNLFAIGQARGTGRFTNGMIAEVRIWDYGRSATQLQAAMGERLSGNESGLVGYWPLNEGSGGTANDLSPSGNNGAIVGAQWVEAPDLPIVRDELPEIPDLPPGQAAGLWFDGESGIVVADGPAVNSHSTEFSAIMWVNGPSGQADKRVFSEGSYTSNTPLFNIGTNSAGGYIDIYWRDDGGSAFVNHALSEGEPFDNTWHHIAVVANNGTMYMYIDGEQDPTVITYDPRLLSVQNTSIGGIQRAAPSHHFEGMIAQVGVFSRALSQSEIRAYMVEGLEGDENGLEAYWPLNEGEGSTAHDLSPNGYDGTISGTTEWRTEDMPNLAGMHWQDAVAALEAAGFTVQMQHVTTGTVAAGQVIAQSPGAGATSAPGWRVYLLVESAAVSFAPAAPACLLLVVMTGVLAAVGYRMRRRVYIC